MGGRLRDAARPVNRNDPPNTRGLGIDGLQAAFSNAPMQPPDDNDALALLDAMARSYPVEADLIFEAWELGFSTRRMEEAVRTLLAAGCVEVEDTSAPLHARRAQLTPKGLSLLRGRGVSFATRERRRRNDRRVSGESTPPEGVEERRHAERDRRHPLSA
jgi:hypothetical protein